MGIRKKEATDIIALAAKNYEEFLNDNDFLIIYEDNRLIDYVEIGFRDSYYLHMTGVKTKLSAQRFYEACLCNRLSGKDFELDKQGKVEQKLNVIPHLHKLLYNNCMIGNFIRSGVVISADYFVGDTKLILSVGFRKGQRKDFPVTLYSGDIRKLTNPTNKVLAIFKKRFSETDYTENTYISKGIDLEHLKYKSDSDNPAKTALSNYYERTINDLQLTESESTIENQRRT